MTPASPYLITLIFPISSAAFFEPRFEFRVNDILSKIRMRSADIAAFAVSGKVSHKNWTGGYTKQIVALMVVVPF